MPDIAMGIDHNYVPSLPPAQNNIEKKVKIMPNVGIYQPPAARRLIAQENVTEKNSCEKLRSKQRRPDIQVYVPRAKRLSGGIASASQEIQTTNSTLTTSNRRHSSSMSSQSYATKPSRSIDVSDAKSCPKSSLENTVSHLQIIANVNDTNSSQHAADDDESFMINSKRQLTQDNVVCHEATREATRDDTEKQCEGNEIMSIVKFDQNPSNKEPIDNVMSSSRLGIDNSQLKCCVENDHCQKHPESSHEFHLGKSVDLVSTLDANCDVTSNEDPCIIFQIDKTILTVDNDNKICEDIHKQPSDTHILIGSDTPEINIPNKCLVEILDKDKLDDDDKCRNHKEQNRKNRSIQRGNINYISDVLVISDTETTCDLIEPVPEPSLNVLSDKPKTEKTILNREEEIGLTEIKFHHSNEEPSNGNTQRLNPDECTWDMMFDENGDCLDPLLMEELTNKVGNVTIKSPRSDYKNYTTRDFQPRDEYSHVIEIYDFPAEFKTQDLITVFSAYRSRGFEIKWVDDTHALGVFSSSVVAEEVLETSHPFLKTRPLHEATSESRAKARRSSEFLQPYRSRPETCPAMARRMVTGALGVRLSTARQEREAEKALLKLARDKKKMEARLKDEAWEGTIIGASSSNGD